MHREIPADYRQVVIAISNAMNVREQKIQCLWAMMNHLLMIRQSSFYHWRIGEFLDEKDDSRLHKDCYTFWTSLYNTMIFIHFL